MAIISSPIYRPNDIYSESQRRIILQYNEMFACVCCDDSTVYCSVCLQVPTARRATEVMSDNGQELRRFCLSAACVVHHIDVTGILHQICCCTLPVESQSCPLDKVGDDTNIRHTQYRCATIQSPISCTYLSTTTFKYVSKQESKPFIH